jgi:hypothetical protein
MLLVSTDVKIEHSGYCNSIYELGKITTLNKIVFILIKINENTPVYKTTVLTNMCAI